jgi:uncharacterized protein YdiU (UPF0061 family)
VRENPGAVKDLTEISWENRWTSLFPGDPETRNFTRQVAGALFSDVSPEPVRSPSLIAWSTPFAQELGLSSPNPGSDALSILAGNLVLPTMRPYASRYGGHQFGHWAGQLGDGRAITLGESVFEKNGRLEFQLKGAGPTPYSRRADGRAVLRSSIREFLCSEAMHALGVPTTRALSLVSTGESVMRDMFYDGNPMEEPGAIVCRVAPSFIRFGSFEIHASLGETDLLAKLLKTIVADHYPEIPSEDPDLAGLFLDAIAERTGKLIAHWMRVGFVHGVMNTDNLSALGLTIDYGPYGWLDAYDPNWTPNTTDFQNRRYRYANQPSIGMWNLARLAEALEDLLPGPERAKESLKRYQDAFSSSYSEMLEGKFGLPSLDETRNEELVREAFRLLQLHETDFTLFFRSLSAWKPLATENESERITRFLGLIQDAFYSPESISTDLLEQWSKWGLLYSSAIRTDGRDPVEREKEMKRVNPRFILRNYLSQEAIQAAEKGNLDPLKRLQRVLLSPYSDDEEMDGLIGKRPEWAKDSPGCSTLSCSS